MLSVLDLILIPTYITILIATLKHLHNIKIIKQHIKKRHRKYKRQVLEAEYKEFFLTYVIAISTKWKD